MAEYHRKPRWRAIGANGSGDTTTAESGSATEAESGAGSAAVARRRAAARAASPGIPSAQPRAPSTEPALAPSLEAIGWTGVSVREIVGVLKLLTREGLRELAERVGDSGRATPDLVDARALADIAADALTNLLHADANDIVWRWVLARFVRERVTPGFDLGVYVKPVTVEWRDVLLNVVVGGVGNVDPTTVVPVNVYVWGSNAFGALGLGETVDVQWTPQRLMLPTTRALSTARVNMTAVCVGAHHTVLVAQSGHAYGYGRNDSGQLAMTPVTIIARPRHITSLGPGTLFGPVVSVSCGTTHTVFVTDPLLLRVVVAGAGPGLGDVRESRDSPRIIRQIDGIYAQPFAATAPGSDEPLLNAISVSAGRTHTIVATTSRPSVHPADRRSDSGGPPAASSPREFDGSFITVLGTMGGTDEHIKGDFRVAPIGSLSPDLRKTVPWPRGGVAVAAGDGFALSLTADRRVLRAGAFRLGQIGDYAPLAVRVPSPTPEPSPAPDTSSPADSGGGEASGTDDPSSSRSPVITGPGSGAGRVRRRLFTPVEARAHASIVPQGTIGPANTRPVGIAAGATASVIMRQGQNTDYDVLFSGTLGFAGGGPTGDHDVLITAAGLPLRGTFADVGAQHVVVANSRGRVWTLGAGDRGQLGQKQRPIVGGVASSTRALILPANAFGNKNVRAVAAGGDVSMALVGTADVEDSASLSTEDLRTDDERAAENAQTRARSAKHARSEREVSVAAAAASAAIANDDATLASTPPTQPLFIPETQSPEEEGEPSMDVDNPVTTKGLLDSPMKLGRHIAYARYGIS